MPWTRLDLALVASALVISLAVIAYRVSQHTRFENAAADIISNVYTVAGAVNQFHGNTGRWFPAGTTGEDRTQVYPDPFHPDAKPYQGLAAETLSRDNNAGLVIQLVEFQPEADPAFPVHLFSQPYRAGEPYLRILLDYGERGQTETEILIRAQNRLPANIIGEVDDHYYVIDLRRLIDVE